MRLYALLAIMAFPALASAQELTGAIRDEASVPAFATLDRTDGQSRLELSSSVSFFDGDDPDFNNRIDLYGQHVAKSGLGGYVTIPFAMIAEGDDSESAIGNLELGAIYHHQNGNLPITWRAGLALPVATDDVGQLVNNLTAFGRLTDISSTIPDTTWFRLSMSPMIRLGNGFLRMDAGVDFPVDSDELGGLNALARLNVGAGVVAGGVALSGELVTVRVIADGGDETAHSAAVSIRSSNKRGTAPYLAVVFPFAIDGEDVVDMVLTAGISVPMGR